MLLYRLPPDGRFAADAGDGLRRLLDDPFSTAPETWRLGEPEGVPERPLAPVCPPKIVGIGRNYRAHAEELGNPVPPAPVIFLKAPTSVLGPGEAILLPPESERVEHEAEIALVVGRRLRRASPDEARRGLLGVTCSCDVTARDIQRSEPTFARAKSFDTFCPLGPAIRTDVDPERLEVIGRVSGEERQRGSASWMLWGPIELLVYASHSMTLEPGDVLLSGTPAGVGPLVDGDLMEVEIPGVGVLANPVRRLQAEEGHG